MLKNFYGKNLPQEELRVYRQNILFFLLKTKKQNNLKAFTGVPFSRDIFSVTLFYFFPSSDKNSFDCPHHEAVDIELHQTRTKSSRS